MHPWFVIMDKGWLEGKHSNPPAKQHAIEPVVFVTEKVWNKVILEGQGWAYIPEGGGVVQII